MLAANADAIEAGVAQLMLALGCLEDISTRIDGEATDPPHDGTGGPRSLAFAPGINVRHMGLAPPRTLAWVGAAQAAAHWRGVLRALCDAARAVRAVRTWAQLRAVSSWGRAGGGGVVGPGGGSPAQPALPGRRMPARPPSRSGSRMFA